MITNQLDDSRCITFHKHTKILGDLVIDLNFNGVDLCQAFIVVLVLGSADNEANWWQSAHLDGIESFTLAVVETGGNYVFQLHLGLLNVERIS